MSPKKLELSKLQLQRKALGLIYSKVFRHLTPILVSTFSENQQQLGVQIRIRFSNGFVDMGLCPRLKQVKSFN